MKKQISAIYVNGDPVAIGKESVPAISVVEESLSDGSKVYDLIIGDHSIACTDGPGAMRCFGAIAEALHSESILDSVQVY